MRVITEVVAGVPPGAWPGKARDTLPMTWEERQWTRRKAVSAAGREVALALPTGTVLEPGDVLAVEADWYLVVEARPEPVLVLFPETHEAALRIAFDVGNRHFSLACDGDTLLVPDDTAMEHLVTRLGVRWERREMVYSPLHPGGDD
ncbi:MAG TPA: urease accessory protein UreE [Methylomirabilota bacterium]|nr:urease accessory protein UreE [Methylomirabilota bacterium]